GEHPRVGGDPRRVGEHLGHRAAGVHRPADHDEDAAQGEQRAPEACEHRVTPMARDPLGCARNRDSARGWDPGATLPVAPCVPSPWREPPTTPERSASMFTSRTRPSLRLLSALTLLAACGSGNGPEPGGTGTF